ncbi:hypothetical protein QFZ96_008125 [Paraburkholderia youngii]
MRLADFILRNAEPILTQWEVFAATLLPAAANMQSSGLRDHAQQSSWPSHRSRCNDCAAEGVVSVSGPPHVAGGALAPGLVWLAPLAVPAMAGAGA